MLGSEEGEEGVHRVSYGVWRASAGKYSHLPRVGSTVFYSPEGHAEQAWFPISLVDEVANKLIPCIVIDLSFFGDPKTDEVFTKYTLQPIPWNNINMQSFFANDDDVVHVGGKVEEYDNPGYVSYCKVLTRSDANNGGGFSVPRQCADTVLPKLRFEDDPPVQNLHIKDVHNKSWEFRHIYRGTPRRHLFTTNWSKFVDDKLLIPGDTVVFVRDNHTKEVTLGIRRYLCDEPDWDLIRSEQQEEQGGGGGGDVGFSRYKRGRVKPSAVHEAIDKALKGMPFQAIYYPRASMAEFVVAANKVYPQISWNPKDRVKIPLENGPKYGSVVSVNSNGGIWRMLQVEWDDEECEALQDMKRVNPWQVERVGCALPNVPLEGVPHHPNPNPNPNPNPLNYDWGIQGARQTNPQVDNNNNKVDNLLESPSPSSIKKCSGITSEKKTFRLFGVPIDVNRLDSADQPPTKKPKHSI